MDDEKKFNRKEISRILKIASELDQENREPAEEGLSREELRKLAEEVGINPNHIDTAIQKFRGHPYEPSLPSFIEENFSYRNTLILDSPINDKLWEDVVTEIRRINGGIGKTSKLGSTYEWEQRKKNVGYLQVSITPKKEQSRIRINASYQYYSNLMGLIGGIIGFTIFSMIGDGLFSAHGLEMLTAGFGAFTGWAASRLYVKSWMLKKREMLQMLSDRFKDIFSEEAVSKPDKMASAGKIETDRPPQAKEKEQPKQNRRLRN